MSEDLHRIDDLFRSGLDGREDAPGPKVWEAIELELDKKDRKPKGGFFLFSGRAAAVALIILGSAALFAGGYYLRSVQLSREEKRALELKEKSDGKDQSLKSGTSMYPSKGAGQQDDQTNSTSVQNNDSAPVTAIPDLGPNTKNADQIVTKEGQFKEEQSTIGQSSIQAGPTDKRTSKRKADQELNNKKPLGKTGQSGLSAPAAIVPNQSNELYSKEAAMMAGGHSLATVEAPEHQHLIPVPARRIPTGTGSLALATKQTVQTSPSANAAQIPVANKRATGLQLPRITITPMVAFQNHSMKLVNDGSSNGKEMHRDMTRTEHMPSKFSGGILADVRIGKRMTLQSGLSLMQMEVYIEPKMIKAEKDIDGKVKYRLDCSAGTYFINPKTGNYLRPGDSVITKQASNSLRYLTIPLALKYYVGNNKVQIFGTAGAGLNILTSQELEAMVKNQYQYYGGRTANLKSSFFSGMVGAGINYYVGKRIGIYMSPQYNFALGSINEGLPVKALPRTFSVQTGVVIKL